MEKIPVIIDCDPGHDDMMALVLAYGSGRLDIRAVTTVAGNNTIENTTNNALNVLHYIGADEIPVAMGYQDPIVRSHKAVMKKMAENSRKNRHRLQVRLPMGYQAWTVSFFRLITPKKWRKSVQLR